MSALALRMTLRSGAVVRGRVGEDRAAALRARWERVLLGRERLDVLAFMTGESAGALSCAIDLREVVVIEELRP